MPSGLCGSCGVGGIKKQRQQAVHSHCVLLDLVSYFTKYVEEPKMQSSQQCLMVWEAFPPHPN